MFKKLNFSVIIDKIKSLKKGNKKNSLIAAVLILVVVFIFAILFFSGKSDKQKTTADISADNYSLLLEQKLENMLLGVSEINSVDVFVMVKGSVKSNYLMETTETENSNGNSSTKTISTKVVYKKLNGETLPIIVSTTYPEILGVMIVINKVSAATKISIKNSISIVLNIPENCISILQEK